MQVAELTKEREKDWDRYVQKSDGGTFYHQIGWRNAVVNTYGCRFYYLMALEDDEIVGILPLFVMGGFPFEKALVSVPFAPYGGICANNQGIENELLKAAKDIAHSEKAGYLELRCFDKTDLNLILRDDFATLILQLDPDSEKLWQSFKPKVRNQTRKAMKSGLEVKIGNQYLRDFYNIYAENMRDLGTPVHSLNLFKNIIREFPGLVETVVLLYSQKIIGGAFLSFYKDTVNDLWASSLREYFQYCPNNLLYREAIKYSCEKGYKYFDFGRSEWNSGTFKFKEQWGAEPKQLYYQYYLPKSDNVPSLNQSSLKYRCFTWTWRKMPLVITNSLGPLLRRNIP